MHGLHLRLVRIERQDCSAGISVRNELVDGTGEKYPGILGTTAIINANLATEQ